MIYHIKMTNIFGLDFCCKNSPKLNIMIWVGEGFFDPVGESHL